MEPDHDELMSPQEQGNKPYSRRVQAAALAAFLAASFLVAGLGGFSTVSNVDGWYVTADKAPWSPPNWLFGPVWTVLYTAMAVAAWLVWRKRTDRTRPALAAYGIQAMLGKREQR